MGTYQKGNININMVREMMRSRRELYPEPRPSVEPVPVVQDELRVVSPSMQPVRAPLPQDLVSLEA